MMLLKWFGSKAAQTHDAGALLDATAGQASFVSGEPNQVVRPARIEVPMPPDAVATHVLYDPLPRSSFELTAVDMGFMNISAADLASRQSLATGDAVADVAVRLGLLTPDRVAEVLERQTLVVRVDARHGYSPAFLTWLEDLERVQIPHRVEMVSAHELSDLQHASTAESVAQRDDAGLQTLALAKRLFEDCAAMNVSDIHVLRRATHTEVQVRILGDMRVMDSMSMKADEGEALIRAIYTGMAGAAGSTFNPLEFQNGQINGYDTFPGTGLTSVRIIRGPMYPIESNGSFLVARLQYGEKPAQPVGRIVETRIPSQPESEFKPKKLGFTPLQIGLIERLLRLPTGIVVVTGPTGSGKTTTLYELLKQQARLFPESRQITMENPPEYPMPWAVQLVAEGDQFQQTLQYMLRMDPDVIQAGELRAGTEVVAALQAAMTGHLVWTTMHVTDPYKVFSRMEMLDPVLLSRAETCDPDKIVGLIAQRLVGILCQRCSVPLSESSADAMPAFMLEALKTWAPGENGLSRVRLKGAGCPHCQGGTTRRVGVAEIVLPDEEFMESVINKGAAVARREHRKRQGSDLSMLGNAMPLILNGMASPMDVHRGVHKIVAKEEA